MTSRSTRAPASRTTTSSPARSRRRTTASCCSAVSGNVVVGGQTLNAGSKSIKLGTFIDATHGQVTITSASDAHGSYQTGLFYGGKFKTRQRGSARP